MGQPFDFSVENFLVYSLGNELFGSKIKMTKESKVELGGFSQPIV
jgi:hypothetical protein